jgi:Family of unknown function (DUF6599)
MKDLRAIVGGVGAVVLALSVLLGPAGAAAQERRGSPELAALVPRLDGWALSEAARSYFPDNLFEYIDGAAESYLSYDFRELLVADFAKTGVSSTMTLEIYDMGTPLNAFGIYGAERYPDNAVVAVGDEGYAEGEALNFLAGRFYVKMLAFGLGEGTETFLRQAGLKVAAAIKPRGELPDLVLAFPKDGLVARSEKYIKKNFMGYEFLRDGYVATYEAGEREIEGFIIDGKTEKDAEAMKARLLAALAADGSSPETIPLGVHVRNRFGQHLYVGQVGPVLCGAMRVPEGLEAAGQALLRALTVSLAERRSAK